jgi:hypothetical protein
MAYLLLRTRIPPRIGREPMPRAPIPYHYQQLSPSLEKNQISFHYLARASVGRKIQMSGVEERQVTGGDGGNPSGRNVLIISGYGRFLAR